ncbi:MULTISPECIES: YggS family pyridoxal phosphate-dependent enzyme [Bifidobacterium]|jgi:pyridoxal phosphate enzyme (YggS family)|uniref:Pyridoxal phosphate homeostasis protein n=1 Tax=Bifidobacterium tibiigranuli TaxID=2172043 RepID=A0A5N6S640_9BIFI|nr:YggS family pyridoxal phosphate-dependent enzyme [Bifidobacterium tibiigranuli]KAE8128742.1 YggS family pyridoxal phosphate-dependent enzyme [Bifidobacterium tibiigranuli]KAE8128933.1 YggS family pyridoxal phosphate-dependent enzyme [Bifidobacterium tibiigranuli]MCH3973544.1 YggS family pyridoxal phosphate-dependent enzyme [Bifidobacterium tibiigranuli]MCI1222282.1 YggS family pyridoxal phosphate-dependent enzyme [Bifidobacterium tibiigranuli]MCI1254842.1 YggS family pyridoxal phosphate-dep
MTSYMEHRDLANETIEAPRAQEITDNVHRVLDRVRAAEESAGREPGSVRLLAATKTRDVGEIMAAIDAGIRIIGENRPQEIAAKADGLRRLCAERGFALGRDDDEGVEGEGSNGEGGNADSTHIPFHLIGQLQTNKIGKVLPVVDTIESVDSLAIAERIARRAVARGIEVGVLLEVNESGEESKSGCNPKNAIDIATRIGIMGGLRLEGLMTIGAHVDDEYAIRKGFERLRHTREQILDSKAPGTEHCAELSMGMTGDMEYAIAEGSTIVRVGTGLFGEREFI